MQNNMKHNLKVEERYFFKDIASLRGYDERLGGALDNGKPYEMTIKLNTLFELCPRKACKKQMYRRLVAFLNEKGIDMKIISRKKNGKDYEKQSSSN